jgi:hypothetical protein
MKHTVGWMGTLSLVGLALARPAALAARPMRIPTPKATIVWVNPRHVTSTDRAALTRLLTEVVSGQQMPGFRVRDSRLRVTFPDCRPPAGTEATHRTGDRPPDSQVCPKTVRFHNLQSLVIPADTTAD